VAFARVLCRVLPCDDIEILALPFFQQFFDALVLSAKTFFDDTLKEFQEYDIPALRLLIEREESRVNWGVIYARERLRIKGKEPYDYDPFIQTVRDWAERTESLPKPEQSTPHLFMAYHHANQVSGKFATLLNGIGEMVQGAEVLVAPLKLPYRALEKMALEESDRKWTARCVMDIGRGAINCPDTGQMTKTLEYLDACTSDVRNQTRPNDYRDLLLHLPEIQVVRVKNRFENPTKGGWADIFINFVFAQDENRHVHELQVQHSNLVHIRKRLGEDARYANLRVLAEILQTAGTC
jgi:hypothetical protein